MVVSGDDEVLSIVRDFTDRRRLEEELQARLTEIEREQEFIATVVNTAPVIFMIVDPEGRIVRFNTPCEQLLGFPNDDAVRGRPFWEVFLAEGDRGRASQMLGSPVAPQELRWTARD